MSDTKAHSHMPISENCRPAGQIVEGDVVGRKVRSVLREFVPEGEEGSYFYYLVLDDDKACTKIIPIGNSLTIHTYDKPNKFTGIF